MSTHHLKVELSDYVADAKQVTVGRGAIASAGFALHPTCLEEGSLLTAGSPGAAGAQPVRSCDGNPRLDATDRSQGPSSCFRSATALTITRICSSLNLLRFISVVL